MQGKEERIAYLQNGDICGIIQPFFNLIIKGEKMRIFGLTANWFKAPIIVVVAESFQAALELSKGALNNVLLPWSEPNVKVLWSFETTYSLPTVMEILKPDSDSSTRILKCIEHNFVQSEKIGAGPNARIFVYLNRMEMSPYLCSFTRDGWVVDPAIKMDEDVRNEIKEYLNDKYPIG